MSDARAVALLLVALSAVLYPLAASAQEDCTEGRLRTHQTRGRCCWPGQAWARDLGRCEGAPTCPAGLAASGDECIAAAETERASAPDRPPVITPIFVAAPEAPPTSATAPSSDLPSWPSASRSGPPGLVNPRWVEESSDSSLVTAGIVLLTVGYVDQLISVIGQGTSDTGGFDGSIYHYDIHGSAGVVGGFDDYSCRNGIAGSLAVPALGPVIAWIVQANCTVPQYEWSDDSRSVVQTGESHDGSFGWIAAAVPGGLMTLIGAIMLPLGLTTHARSVHVTSAGLSFDLDGARASGSGAHLSLASHAPGANAGLSLRIDF
jgi:hypothetical protein